MDGVGCGIKKIVLGLVVFVTDLNSVVEEELTCFFELGWVGVVGVDPVEFESRVSLRGVEFICENDIKDGLVFKDRALRNIVPCCCISIYL